MTTIQTTHTGTIEIVVNGKTRQVAQHLTVGGLLVSLDLHPGMIVVEHNLEILPRDRYNTAEVRDGDRLELVHFVGGG